MIRLHVLLTASVGLALLALPSGADGQDVLRSPAPQYASDAVSAEFPYESKFVSVLGSKMHYIDEGAGDTFLFLHGNLRVDQYSLRKSAFYRVHQP